VLVYPFASAQETSKVIKNDIGFNTNFILNGIFNSGSNPFSFVYKHQAAAQSAVRFGVSFNVNLNSISGNPTNYSQQNFYSVTPSIGKEWQLQLSKRWIWYYGSDVRASFSESNYKYFNDGQVSTERQSSYFGLSVSPFLGIRFTINERLYAATEANLNIGYNHQQGSEKTYTSGSPISSQEYTTNGFTANTASAFGIFIFYRF
jgi:hypothetical protein